MRDGAIYLHAMFRTGSTYLAARFAADRAVPAVLRAAPRRPRLAAPAGAGGSRLRGAAAGARARGDRGGILRRLRRARPRERPSRVGGEPPPLLGARSAERPQRRRACLPRGLRARGRARRGGGRSSASAAPGCRSGRCGRRCRAGTCTCGATRGTSSPRTGRAATTISCRRRCCSCSPRGRLAPAALALARLSPVLPPLVRAASLRLPPPLVARLGRRLARGLSPEEGYALFYLGWLACFEHARAHAELSFSLSEALASAARRRAVEAALEVRLEGLRPIDRAERAARSRPRRGRAPGRGAAIRRPGRAGGPPRPRRAGSPRRRGRR